MYAIFSFDQKEVIKQIDYISSTVIKIYYNNTDFPARSRFKITVTFDNVIFIDCPDLITVYNKFKLAKIIPNIVQINISTQLLLYSEIDPLNSQTGVWDTKGKLVCAFQS